MERVETRMGYDHKTYEEGNTILEVLAAARILEVARQPDGRVTFTDGCDGYYEAVLTPAQVRNLAAELLALCETCAVESSADDLP